MDLASIGYQIAMQRGGRSLDASVTLSNTWVAYHLPRLTDIMERDHFKRREGVDGADQLPIFEAIDQSQDEKSATIDGAQREQEQADEKYEVSKFTPSALLCGTCKGLLKADLFDLKAHHSSVGRLKASAIRCRLCLLLYQAFVLYDGALETPFEESWVGDDGMPLSIQASLIGQKDSVQSTGEAMTVKCFNIRSLCFTLSGTTIKGITPTKKNHRNRVEIEVTRFPENVTKLVDSLAEIESKSYKDARLAIAKHWLDICRWEHKHCAMWQKSRPKLPKRVVNVGSLDNATPPFLYESKEESDSYLCLSHRWGGIQVIQTTQDSLESRKKGIDWQSLPRTLRDAIVITRHLGIQYLWVDSLCIIQDDPADWEAEAKNMGQIYRNAELTIAAVAANDANSGCFHPCQKTHGWPVFVGEECLPPDEMSGQTPIRRRCYAKMASPSKLGIQDSFRPRGPLDSRGWVLQEELFSQRQLSFCEEGIFWECIEAYSSERSLELQPTTEASRWSLNHGSEYGDLHKMPEYLLEGRFFARAFKRGLLAASMSKTLSLASDITLSRAWDALIENYTHRRLTFESDILIAIQGLVTAVAAVTGDTNVAGLWRERLHQQLLWHIDLSFFWSDKLNDRDLVKDAESTVLAQQGSDGPDRRGFDLPSWSWASVRRKITFQDTATARPLMEFVDAKAKTMETSDLYCRLVLRGTLCAMKVLTPEQNGSKVHKLVSLDDDADVSEYYYVDDIEWKDSRALCLAIADGIDESIQCIVLFPTENCKLVCPESNVLEFRRIGYVSWNREMWYRILRRKDMLDSEEEPSKVTVEII